VTADTDPEEGPPLTLAEAGRRFGLRLTARDLQGFDGARKENGRCTAPRVEVPQSR
jgi:hypothetical protein